MENLLSFEEYSEKIEKEAQRISDQIDAAKLSKVFAEHDTTQTGTIDKFDLATVLEKVKLKKNEILNSKKNFLDFGILEHF